MQWALTLKDSGISYALMLNNQRPEINNARAVQGGAKKTESQ